MTDTLTTAEAAQLLGVSQRRIRQYVEDERLRPIRRVGPAFLLDRSDVLSLVRRPSGRPSKKSA